MPVLWGLALLSFIQIPPPLLKKLDPLPWAFGARARMEVVFHNLLFLFMPSPLRYGRKREGHPCIEKGMNMTVSTI